MNIVQIICIIAALIAACVSVVLYIQLYMRQKNSSRETIANTDTFDKRDASQGKKKNGNIKIIGILNLVIGVAMICVFLTFPMSSATQSTTLVIWGIGLVAIFIVGQVIYFIFVLSLQQRKTQKNSLPPPISNMDMLDGMLRDCITNDTNITRIQILDMSYSLDLDNVYVPVEVFSDPMLEEEKLDEKEPADLERLLEQEQKKMQNLVRYAENPIDIIGRESWKQCVLLGEPGMGKTTFLRYFALQMAQKKITKLKDVTPIYIELNTFLAYISEKKDIFSFVADQYATYYSKLYRSEEKNIFNSKNIKKFLRERGENGKLMLLADSLDETFGGVDREDANRNYAYVCKAINNVAKQYPKVRILVTSRKASYFLMGPLVGANGDRFKALEMPGFSQEQKGFFVTNMLAGYQQQFSDGVSAVVLESLMVVLQQDQHLADLSKLPLLLAMITIIYSRGYNVSSNRAEIYDEAVNTLLKRWDKTRGLYKPEIESDGSQRFSEFYPGDKYHFLEELAWTFHNQKHKAFNSTDVLRMAKEFLDKRLSKKTAEEAMINEIITGSNLLETVGAEGYSFSHRIFQEYFTAQWCVSASFNQEKPIRDQQRNDYLELLLSHQGEAWWEEVILLYAAYSGVELIGRRLLATEYEDIFYSNLLLAGRYVTATDKSTNSSLMQKIEEQLFDLLRKTPHAKLQRQIAMILAEVAQVYVQNPLHEHINKKLVAIVLEEALPITVRYAVVLALGKWGNEGVIDQFRILLLESPKLQRVDTKILNVIALTLAQRRSLPLAQELMQLLDQPIDLKLRRCITWSIGFIGRSYSQDESLSTSLIGYLGNFRQGSTFVRLDIIRALQRLENPLVIPDLCDLLASYFINDDERTQIVIALRALVPLSKDSGEQEKVITLLSDTLTQAKDGGQFAQECILTLGIWLRYTIIRKVVTSHLQTLKQEQSSNLWLRRRVSALLALLDTENSSLITFDLFSGNAIVDREFIDFLKGLELSIQASSSYKNITPFFNALLSIVFDETYAIVVRESLIKLLSKVAKREMIKELLAYLVNKPIESTIFITLTGVIQEAYESGLVNAIDVYGNFLSVLKRAVQQDVDGNLLVNIADTIATTSPKMSSEQEMPSEQDVRKEAIELLRASEHSKKAHTGIYYTLSLGTLGDESVIRELVNLLCQPIIIGNSEQDSDIREKIVLILERFSRQSESAIIQQWEVVVPLLTTTLANTALQNVVRKNMVTVLKHIARNVDTSDIASVSDIEICRILVDYISDKRIMNTVYWAVEEISKQKDFRVYQNIGNIKISVQPWKNFRSAFART